MKTIAAVLVAVSLTAVPLLADEVVQSCAKMEIYRQFNLPRFERHYLESLRFPVDAVVECTLREIALIKLAQPGLENPKIYQRVQELADGGNSPVIRYKASLVRIVFDNPDLFVAEGWREYRNDQDVFTAISRRLEKSVLAVMER
jgi:hypothetical protein